MSKIPPKTYALLDSPICTDALYATTAQLAASSNSYLVPHISNTDTLVLDPSLTYTYSCLNTRLSPTFVPHSAVVDTGASFHFAGIDHPNVLPWSIRPLDKHISIAQGSSAATCRHAGLALLIFQHATSSTDAMVLLVPVLVMEEFQPGLFLLSTGALHISRVQLVDPVDHAPFLLSTPENTASLPQRVEDISRNTMAIRCHRSHSLIFVDFHPANRFDRHFDLATAQPFALTEALTHLKSKFSPYGALHTLQKPSDVPDYITHSTSLRDFFPDTHYHCGSLILFFLCPYSLSLPATAPHPHRIDMCWSCLGTCFPTPTLVPYHF